MPYGRKLSSNGFFNNPCRLSPKKFVSWCIKRENKKKLINFIKKQKQPVLHDWLKLNKGDFLRAQRTSQIKEMYLPRIFFNFWLEDKLNFLIKNKSNNIEIFLIKSDVIKISKTNKHFKLITKEKIIYSKLNRKNENFPINENLFSKLGKKELSTDFLFISLGLPSPKKIVKQNIIDNKFYIHDLYESGGSQKLIKLIREKNKKVKKIKVHFLGSKAGFLECLPELKNLSDKKKVKLEIISTSNNAQILNAAILSKKWKSYKLKYFSSKLLKLIKSSKDLLNYIIKEFNYAEDNGFFKYDAWTKILSANIINKVISKFTNKELNNYKNFYFYKIRNITRFTYPFTVNAKEILERKKIIKMLKGKIHTIYFKNNSFFTSIKTGSKKTIIKSDILVSVLGPDKPKNYYKNNRIIKYLTILNKNKMNYDGLSVDNNFRFKNSKGVYLPGFHASGYNTKRETIIKAVTENASIASKNLFSEIIKN